MGTFVADRCLDIVIAGVLHLFAGRADCEVVTAGHLAA